MTTYIKPCIKWVGGKTKILDYMMPSFPREINNYHEPFLGGGSVLLALLCYIKNGGLTVNGSIYAYDLNEPLVYMYKNIQSNHIVLYNKIKEIIDEYHSCGVSSVINRKPKNIDEAMESKENYYYWIRSQYNSLSKEEKTGITGSAMLIFMNKTGFRGVFRVGPNGYNVPYGHYSNPEIANLEHLTEIHDLIQGVIFECADFSDVLPRLKQGDFAYLDPPYVPETKNSFVGYTDNGFNLEQHKKLFDLCYHLTNEKVRFIMNNADVEMIREVFNKNPYNIDSIICNRSIHSKHPESKTKEIIIKNY
uniref:site-specific DNA-methyltransferase (adenine-specific) n=1 Tax=viral metagenome TaxID=1070528 RepID=A0A6C0D3A2_9ZZZZ